ncbi:quinone oxidoreductase%2C NADPH-dependent [Escherichia coli]|nr:quinone oxidoreductase%2C NADPH-dependent [Escherichia coli]CTW51972.1 quinone oxidoreductase%2C NADPH-dependent [Escherichia coli]
MATRIEFHKHGGPEVLQAVEFTPADPAENEIQVENKAIGINFIDTYIRSGLYPPRPLPAAITTQRIRYRSGRHRE